MSELGEVTTLNSVAVGAAAPGRDGALDADLSAVTQAGSPAIPEATLVAVLHGALVATPDDDVADVAAARSAVVLPDVHIDDPEVAPVTAPLETTAAPAPSLIPPTAAPDGLLDVPAPTAIPEVGRAAVSQGSASASSSATVIIPVDRPQVRRRRLWPRLLAVVVAVVVAAAVLAGIQLARPLPKPVVRSAVTLTSTVPGTAPALPWPTVGEAAVAVPALGLRIVSGPEPRVPIASLTKIMTAYLTLRDHPLAPGAQGPMLTFSAADAVEAVEESEDGATSVPVVAGERLSERQVLNGLLVHSANNLANVLARWDAGSVAAFVAKMNVTAAALGMHDTHYADANGLSPASVGSAGDELRIAALAMANPTFAAVVAQPAVTLPIAGLLPNYVTAVGKDGIVGLKSGFTQAAMGCLVLAGVRVVDGRSVLVLAAVTGQPGLNPLDTANNADLRLINTVGSGLQLIPVTSGGTPVASVTTPWSRERVPAVAASTASLVAWPGQVLRVRVSADSPRAGAPAGTRIGTLTVSIGPEHTAVAVRSTRSMSTPSVRWRLTQR